MTTKELEQIAYMNLWKQGTYLCFEVQMPQKDGSHYMINNERVDLLSYETKGVWRFYELKVSKSDFHSKCKKTFLGNFNYYIMPYDLYEQVANEIPENIGVYVANDRGSFWCVKKPKRQELQVNHEYLMFNFMQALSREYRKYRKSMNKGTWIPSNIPNERYVCSMCGGACWMYDSSGCHVKSRFCPNCGAEMKKESD